MQQKQQALLKWKELLNFLRVFNKKLFLGNCPEANFLRNYYIFKIVPILNPDGALCGNFRCSFTGTDLNRRWDQPDEILHPQIFYLKKYLQKLRSEEKEILAFCDFHSHNKKANAFMYGCNKAANGGFCSWTKVRLLPRILANKTHLFSYHDCRFRVENDKQRTARVILWKEFEVTNSFTLESSFYGYNLGKDIIPYTIEDYNRIGKSLMQSILEYTYVLKSLTKEMAITRGWLKPSRLVQLGGTLAADELEKKIALEKEEEKKSKRMAQIKNIMFAKKAKAKKSRREKTKHAQQEKKGDNNFPYLFPKKKEKDQKCANTSQIIMNSLLPTISEGRNMNDVNEIPSSAVESVNVINQVSSQEGKNWRDYFSQEEIEKAYDFINQGIDPTEEEKDNDGSDSNPSEDNLEIAEMDNLFDNVGIKDIPKSERPQEKIKAIKSNSVQKNELLITNSPVVICPPLNNNLKTTSSIHKINLEQTQVFSSYAKKKAGPILPPNLKYKGGGFPSPLTIQPKFHNLNFRAQGIKLITPNKNFQFKIPKKDAFKYGIQIESKTASSTRNFVIPMPTANPYANSSSRHLKKPIKLKYREEELILSSINTYNKLPIKEDRLSKKQRNDIVCNGFYPVNVFDISAFSSNQIFNFCSPEFKKWQKIMKN